MAGNKLYAFIQSAIDNPDVTNDANSRNSRNLRILEFDVATQQVTGEYLYLLDDITGTGNARTDKIGDAVSLGGGKFAVVERDDLSNENSNKLIYQIDLAGATNINNPANFNLPDGKTIEQLTEAELIAAGISVVSKQLIVNAAEVGYTGVEKLEGLALVDRNTLALLNDNDFSVGGTTIPIKLGILELSKNIVPQYGKIALAPNINNNIFTIRGVGETVKLKVILVSNTFNVVNELGIFSTDDNEGTIRRDDGISIKPGQEGYREAALERAKNQGKSVFSAIANLPNLTV
ncbi:esterase-like activity of phytase family protein [Sphaerospermopsis sp. LEGE 00249]|nr:esterase-like activity of phytase family protein [Sphaerospermopsis sp. LEGE 00249]